ncbi:diphthine synthase [Candidatus Pacearchaeota archaeon]|nr:diphthine synthase [Candidatus Pacearchaeota archaeon]|tara:strand:+ start:124 stop:834 length:711 start_codon:yes stop_codon:yes gene_type:complete
MLYLIGLGLNEKSISLEAKEAVKKCKKIYLETYTVNFPYKINTLDKSIGKKITSLKRDRVESNNLVKEAKKQDISLLIYGSPFFATTHMSLIEECKKTKTRYKIIYNASIFDAIAETGLQLYKFGKISSMPKWEKSYQPSSFLNYIKENKKINAHSLILIDPELNLRDALNQLESSAKEKNIKLNKIIIASNLGTKKGKIYYDTPPKLKSKKTDSPFCLIIPGKMHFLEEEVIKNI